MNFEVVGTGHSFKGSMAYYLHDKRQEGMDAHPTTADRVAWTETRNLATTGPHTATRIMIATAQRADELKAAAGIKNTGRKATAGPVFAFSLAWHPNEAGDLDRVEMSKAADHALKVLGLDHLQAVLVAHRDTAHPHVHVILNRVDPRTGKMATVTPNAVRALDKWANDYERERGQIVSPNRAKKYEDQEQKRKRFPDAADRKKYIEAKKELARQFKAAGSEKLARPEPAQKPPQDLRADPRKKFDQVAAVKPAVPTSSAKPARPKSEASILKDLTDAQKARHAQEWKDLAVQNKAQRDQLYAEYGAAIGSAAAEHKTKTKPAWSAFFRAARQSERAFFKREQSIVGILENAIAATRLGERGSLRALFGNVLSAESRVAAFKAAQEAARGDVGKQVKAQLDSHITALRQQREAALAAQRLAYANTRATLIERQDAEKAKIRAAWKQVYDRRGKDPSYLARQKAAPPMELKPMKEEFGKRGQLPDTTQAKVWPTTQQSLSTPAPAPSPFGDVPAARRTVQDVPKTERVDTSQERSPTTPPVAKDWGIAHAPTAAPTAQHIPDNGAANRSYQTPAEIRAAYKAANPEPEETPSRSRGRGLSRDIDPKGRGR